MLLKEEKKKKTMLDSVDKKSRDSQRGAVCTKKTGGDEEMTGPRLASPQFPLAFCTLNG